MRQWSLACVPALGGLLACGGGAPGASPVVGASGDATAMLADGAGHDAKPIASDMDGHGPDGDGRSPDAEASALECSTCPDASDTGGQDDAGGLASPDADAATALDVICQVRWPQPLNVATRGIQLAVDAAGNAYLAISYSPYISLSTLHALDLGVAQSPSYSTGVAVAKVDAACNLVWVRTLGCLGDFVENTAIAVDSQSNVTVLGAFYGNVDFSGTTLGNPDASATYAASFPYLMRFSTSGQVVFRQILQPTSGYQMLNAPSLAVRDDGTSTLAIFEGYATDGGGSVAAQTFMRFDGAGAVVFQSIPSTASPFVGPGDDLLTDPSGGFWALGGSGDGVNAPYVMSLLYHLTATGSVTWTQSYDSSWLDPLFAAGSGRAYLLHTAASSSAVAPTETIVSYPPDGTSSWTQVSQAPSSVAGMIADQMVIDARGNAIVGVSFPSSMVTAADGAVTTTPSAIGFQSFDATGHLRSTRTWDPQVISPPSVQEAPVHFGAIGVDPSGNVLLAATAGQDQETFTILLAKLAQ